MVGSLYRRIHRYKTQATVSEAQESEELEEPVGWAVALVLEGLEVLHPAGELPHLVQEVLHPLELAAEASLAQEELEVEEALGAQVEAVQELVDLAAFPVVSDQALDEQREDQA